MIKRETVSSWQMAALYLSFMTGSAIVNIPAPLTGAAKNAAWLSLWMAGFLGFLLLMMISFLHRRFPEMTLVEYSRRTMGEVPAALIMMLFTTMLLLMLSNIVIDIGDFFKSTMMRETPVYIFHAAILLTSALTVQAGVEVMARMFTLFLIIMFSFTILVLVFTLPIYRPEFLLPLFPDGFKPVWHGTYFAWGFPYSETVVFSMILPFVRKDKEPLGKLMATGLLINIISLSAVLICTMMAMGPVAESVKYSVFVLAKLIEVREIVERVESVIGMALIVGSYMKATLVLFALNMAVTQLFRLRDDRLLIYPLALISLLLTLTMFHNELEFGEMVHDYWPLFLTFFGVIPVLLVAVAAAWRGIRDTH